MKEKRKKTSGTIKNLPASLFSHLFRSLPSPAFNLPFPTINVGLVGLVELTVVVVAATGLAPFGGFVGVRLPALACLYSVGGPTSCWAWVGVVRPSIASHFDMRWVSGVVE
jgi:hypothetical protein